MADNQEAYRIRRILEKRKEKNGVRYLVDWAPSMVSEADVDAGAIQEWERIRNGVRVVGPYEPSVVGGKAATKWKWVVQLGSSYEILPYNEVLEKYKDELLHYFVSQATVNESNDKRPPVCVNKAGKAVCTRRYSSSDESVEL